MHLLSTQFFSFEWHNFFQKYTFCVELHVKEVLAYVLLFKVKARTQLSVKISMFCSQ